MTYYVHWYDNEKTIMCEGFFLKVIIKIKALRHKAWQGVWRLTPIKQNKIILWADNFKSFGCSPKYIALYLAEHFAGKYDLVWVLEQGREVPAGLPEGIRIVRHFSMQYLKEIATAKVVICNARTGKVHAFKKRGGQYYIQTWHSSLRLKKIEGDAPGLSDSYVQTAIQDSRKIDLLLSGCRFSTDIFRRAFWYDGEILESGTPRCDGFFADPAPVRQKVYRYYGIDPSQKLVLYAPTFRKDKKPSLYGFDPGALQNALGSEWVVGCRLHPNLNGQVDTGTAISMSGYPDMQELLVACDLLITDYSSSMFDMAVAGKRCVLYVPDLAQYMANERGLYFDMEALPFSRAQDMESLCRCVQEFDSDTYQNSLAAFREQIGSYEDGNAAMAVAERIEKVCYGESEHYRSGT